MDGTEDFRLRRGIDAVRQTGEAFVQLRPERDALGHGRLVRHRTQTGNLLVLHLAGMPAGFDHAELQGGRRGRNRLPLCPSLGPWPILPECP